VLMRESASARRNPPLPCLRIHTVVVTRSADSPYRTFPVSASVNPRSQKYSTLPKFGFGVCVAHPGSSRRGDLEVVLIASRVAVDAAASCAKGAGRAGSPCEPAATCGRAAPKSGEASWRSRMSCVRQNRVVLTVVATVKSFAKVRASPTGQTASSKFAGRGRPKEWSAPGRSRHKPSDHCAGKAE